LAGALEGARRIGLPMGAESSLRMPLLAYARLKTLLSARFCDASPLLRALRMVKSKAEIALIRRICAIASRAFARAPDLFCEGQPLDAAFRAFRVALLMEGADDVPYLVGGAGQGGYGDVISPPDATQLARGDVLLLDTGATLDGYFCDFNRNFAIAHADEASLAAHRALFSATAAGLAAARPGATCADLFNAMAAALPGSASAVGRFGHGLGMQLTEWPSVAPWEETVLKPGMVMTLEPSMEIAPGRMMVHEENILITEDAPELLSTRTPRELPVIG
ncbi:MAG: M24 family metallopeptidase, partial [Paracoccaceae bacterium]